MNIIKNAIAVLGLVFLPSFLTAQIVDNNSLVAKGAKVEKLGSGYSFTEGPAADKEGNVYFTDQPNNKILKWNAATGKIDVFSDEAGRSNGLYFDQKGQLIACADEKNQLWAFDEKGNPKVLLEDFDQKLLNGPNDLWIHPNGGIYFTDPLYKRDYWERNPEKQQDGEHVYYISPDKENVKRVEEKLVKPNGIIGTPDGKKLYVADIEDDKTYVYDIDKNGNLSNRALFTNLGSDGMTIDNKGNVYLTGKGVTVFDKTGKKIAHFPIDAGWTANITFGGKDKQILFITAMDAVYGLKMNVKGAK
jgi:gluconolactonase